MRITRSREYTINMGNYESLKIGATVEVDLEKYNNNYENAFADAGALLDKGLADDVKEAQELTDVRNSYILSWRNN